jgi:hypothetical protein
VDPLASTLTLGIAAGPWCMHGPGHGPWVDPWTITLTLGVIWRPLVDLWRHNVKYDMSPKAQDFDMRLSSGTSAVWIYAKQKLQTLYL